MLTKPQRVTNAINNRVTVALPITSLDIDYLSENMRVKLNDLKDVDASALADGAMLVWDEETESWQVTKTNIVIDGGWR
jgi:hypothetical protein